MYMESCSWPRQLKTILFLNCRTSYGVAFVIKNWDRVRNNSNISKSILVWFSLVNLANRSLIDHQQAWHAWPLKVVSRSQTKNTGATQGGPFSTSALCQHTILRSPWHGLDKFESNPYISLSINFITCVRLGNWALIKYTDDILSV